MQSDSADDDEEALRVRQLEEDLEVLKKEHEEILAGENTEFLEQLKELEKRKMNRLYIAEEIRNFQLVNSEKSFEAEIKQAWDEFGAAKKDFQEKILTGFLDRRRRLDTYLPRAIRKQLHKRRRLWSPDSNNGSTLLESLRHNGLLRVSLSWDEMQHDMEALLHRLEAAVPAQTMAPAQPRHAPAPFADSKPADAAQDPAQNLNLEIFTAKEVLHVRNVVFGKSSAVVVWNKSTRKRFSGNITSISPKEILIKTNGGNMQKVYLSHLRSGKKTISHLPAS